jgi:hypothetical protein
MRLLLLLLAAHVLYGQSYDPALEPPPGFVPRKFSKPAPASTASPENLFSFSLDFIYWQSRAEGLEYGLSNSGTQSNQDLKQVMPDFPFQPGFKLSLGTRLPRDFWNLSLLYTFNHSSAQDSILQPFNANGTPGPGILSVWTYPAAFSDNNVGARFQSAQSDWKLHMSLFDLALSRTAFLGKAFSVTPSFGLRCAWITQRYDLNYSGGNLIQYSASSQVTVNSSQINLQQRSNNFGPFFGALLDWNLGKGLHFLTAASGALQASFSKTGRDEFDTYTNTAGALQTQAIHVSRKSTLFAPQAQGCLGFRYTDSLSTNTRISGYFLSAFYEAHVRWRLNQFLRYLDSMNASSAGANVAPTLGDLVLHGLTLEGGLNF